MKQELITHFGRVRLATTIANRNTSGDSYFRLNMRYINNLRKPVTLKMRSGLETLIPAVDLRSTRSNDNEFLIQQELVVEPNMIERMRQFFAGIDENACGVLLTFRDSFQSQYAESAFHLKPIVCTIDHVVTLQDFTDANGLIYHDALDLVLQLGDAPLEMPHPHSSLGRQAFTEENMAALQDEHGFIFSVEIIDSLGRYGERYVSICNNIFKITPQTGNNKPDGIYIVSSKPTNGRLSSTSIVTNHYDFDDAEKRLGLYPTYEQALSAGDQAALRRRELVEMEHQLQCVKAQAALSKAEADREIAERDAKLKTMEYEQTCRQRDMDELRSRQDQFIEMERQRLKEESERRKEEYEKRSSERKDTSELLKFLPHVLAAIGTMLMAYKTFRA